MTDPQVAILMLCLFIVLVLLGFPIAFTLLAMGVGFGYYAYHQSGSIQEIADAFNNQIFYLLNQNTYSVMENDTLVAIPLFLFMGYIVERANIVDRLFSSLQLAARNLPGSMAIAALITCAVFSTASGIVGAVVTLFLETADGQEFKVQLQQRELDRLAAETGASLWVHFDASNAHLIR